MDQSVNLESYDTTGSCTVLERPSPQPMPKYGISRDVEDMSPRHGIANAEVEDMLPRQGIADPEVGSLWLGVFPMRVTRLHSDTYELVEPIEVQVEKYGEGYLVTDEDVDRHGVGLTIEDALRDYEEILLGYFESLSRRQDRLSPRLKQHLEFLRQAISRM